MMEEREQGSLEERPAKRDLRSDVDLGTLFIILLFVLSCLVYA